MLISRSSKISKRKGLMLGGLTLLVLAVVVMHLRARPAADHPFFNQFDDTPLVIAHAGSKLYPTDTLYALEQYAAMGVDMLEMDIHMTQDGHAILIHDETVDRTTNGTGDVRELTLAQVQALDAGHYWTQDDGQTYPFRGQGIVIPTLESVLLAFPGYPMTIEIKQETPSMAQPFCEQLQTHNMQEKVIVASFSDAALQEFRQACPQVATSASTGEVRNFVIRNFLFLAGTISPQYHAFQVPESRDGIPVVTKLFLKAAHKSNIQVQIWTVNDPAEMQRFIDMGLDGIITDRTDLLIEILDQ